MSYATPIILFVFFSYSVSLLCVCVCILCLLFDVPSLLPACVYIYIYIYTFSLHIYLRSSSSPTQSVCDQFLFSFLLLQSDSSVKTHPELVPGSFAPRSPQSTRPVRGNTANFRSKCRPKMRLDQSASLNLRMCAESLLFNLVRAPLSSLFLEDSMPGSSLTR